MVCAVGWIVGWRNRASKSLIVVDEYVFAILAFLLPLCAPLPCCLVGWFFLMFSSFPADSAEVATKQKAKAALRADRWLT